MQVGGERKLVIRALSSPLVSLQQLTRVCYSSFSPPTAAALAYGKKGTQGIPGNATLTFDVKLVSLK